MVSDVAALAFLVSVALIFFLFFVFVVSTSSRGLPNPSQQAFCIFLSAEMDRSPQIVHDCPSVAAKEI